MLLFVRIDSLIFFYIIIEISTPAMFIIFYKKNLYYVNINLIKSVFWRVFHAMPGFFNKFTKFIEFI